MYEIDVRNRHTGERDTIYGYDFEDACRRNDYDPNDYIFEGSWYVD